MDLGLQGRTSRIERPLQINRSAPATAEGELQIDAGPQADTQRR
jgi:hypothetical protein